MLGVCLGTISLVVVLSVFNGLEDLNRQVFKAFDPDLKISSKSSRSFLPEKKLLEQLNNIKGVAYVSEVYKDKALARSKDAQMIVVLNGVDQNFEKNKELKAAVVEGQMKLDNSGRPNAFVGGGVYDILDLSIDDFLNPLGILYPKNQKLNVLNPDDNISKIGVEVSGVFVLEQQYDNYIYLPIATVENLTGKVGQRTALEITMNSDSDLDIVKKSVKEVLNSGLEVKDRDEQNAALLRAIKIEKLFIFIALFFIVGIASFNIFYALSMLVIDKKDDIETLSSLGASSFFVRNIFMIEGYIISIVGLIIGLVLGVGICIIQQKFEIVELGMANALVNAYPVKIIFSDIFWSVSGIILITFFAAYIPARKASKLMLNTDS